ncbi:hypothetical protein PL81_20880 [Streptomyces sp. RSD-27]|nr:hypothetical protein PL81_20880 [Streptomyces sp. RSD-27]
MARSTVCMRRLRVLRWMPRMREAAETSNSRPRATVDSWWLRTGWSRTVAHCCAAGRSRASSRPGVRGATAARVGLSRAVAMASWARAKPVAVSWRGRVGLMPRLSRRLRSATRRRSAVTAGASGRPGSRWGGDDDDVPVEGGAPYGEAGVGQKGLDSGECLVAGGAGAVDDGDLDVVRVEQVGQEGPQDALGGFDVAGHQGLERGQVYGVQSLGEQGAACGYGCTSAGREDHGGPGQQVLVCGAEGVVAVGGEEEVVVPERVDGGEGAVRRGQPASAGGNGDAAVAPKAHFRVQLTGQPVQEIAGLGAVAVEVVQEMGEARGVPVGFLPAVFGDLRDQGAAPGCHGCAGGEQREGCVTSGLEQRPLRTGRRFCHEDQTGGTLVGPVPQPAVCLPDVDRVG